MKIQYLQLIFLPFSWFQNSPFWNPGIAIAHCFCVLHHFYSLSKYDLLSLRFWGRTQIVPLWVNSSEWCACALLLTFRIWPFVSTFLREDPNRSTMSKFIWVMCVCIQINPVCNNCLFALQYIFPSFHLSGSRFTVRFASMGHDQCGTLVVSLARFLCHGSLTYQNSVEIERCNRVAL